VRRQSSRQGQSEMLKLWKNNNIKNKNNNNNNNKYHGNPQLSAS
jgi:hypothetical protein